MAGGTCSAHISASSVQANQARTTQSRRRPRRSNPHISSSSSPSSGLLALLATLASSSSVDAKPLVAPPLTFLYPFIEEHSSEIRVETHPTRTHSADPFPPPTGQSLSRRGVSLADKYASGSDGRWRKLDEYTLYGSTIRSVPTSMSIEDDAAGAGPTPSASTSSSTSEVTAKSTSIDDLYESLPVGWQPTDNPDRPTAIIAVLSVLLACLIIIVIALSAYWRRRRKLARDKDPEKKMCRKDDGEDVPVADEDAADAQQIRSQKRMVVKATARWKANARQSFRKRRPRWASRKYAASRQDLRENDSSVALPQPRSPSPSTTISSNLPTTQLAHSPSPSIPSQSRASLRESQFQPPDRSTTPPASPTFPPAYFRSSRRHLAQSGGAPGSLHIHIPVSPFTDPDSQSPPPFTGTDDEAPVPPLNTVAHVATDDKAVLARMAAMSSSPPAADNPGEASRDVRPSVPSWYDEDHEDYSRRSYDHSLASGRCYEPCTMPEMSTANSCEASTSRLLPPPPEKAQLTAPLFYDYPSSFEEDLTEPEPSAPPFEECVAMPSAPPLESEAPPPSAPPVGEYEEDFSTCAVSAPSAPAFDDYPEEAGTFTANTRPRDDLWHRPSSPRMGVGTSSSSES